MIHNAPEAADLVTFQQRLPQLYALRDLAALPTVMLDLASELIPNLYSTYNELTLQGNSVVAVYRPTSWRRRHEAVMPVLNALLPTHPIYRSVNATGDGHTQLLSDHFTEKEWLATDFGQIQLSLGVRDSLVFCLRHSSHAIIYLALYRATWSFNERDRQLAELMRPHFIAAHENAIAFTEARAIALTSARSLDHSPQGIAVIDEQGQIMHLNARAMELLERYFPRAQNWKTTLPPALSRWLQSPPPSLHMPPPVFERAQGQNRLIVRAAQESPGRKLLLLRESEPPADPQRLRALGLSRREAEVLHWAAAGKNNAAIGAILHISARTVGKHLEAIYDKLGVASRTEAAMRAASL